MSNDSPSGRHPEDTTFFGHPHGLSTLFFTEMWERFSYYSMHAILLFYLIDSFSKGGLGMNTSIATSIVAIYGALIYMSTVIGGFISDRILGPRRTVFWGGVLIALGNFILVLPLRFVGLYVSIVIIVLGTGFLKPNVSDMVGGLYSKEDTRRDAGFNIYYMGINIGALLAPFIVGWVGQTYSYHAGFALSTVGMVLGLIQYCIGSKKYLGKDGLLPNDPIKPDEKAKVIKQVSWVTAIVVVGLLIMYFTHTLNVNNIIFIITILGILLPAIYFFNIFRSPKITPKDRKNVIVYIVVFIASVFFWSIYEQTMTIFPLVAQQMTDLKLFGIHVQASQFTGFNALFVLVYSPIVAAMWTKMGKKQPSSTSKFTIGLLASAFSFLVLLIPIAIDGVGVKFSGWWLILSIAIVEIGEVFLSPSGLSLTTKLAPKAFNAQMMSIWFLGDAAAQSFNAQLVKLYSVPNAAMYFGVMGVVAIVIAVILFSMRGMLAKLIQL